MQCEECRRWFCSSGGLAVHSCRREEVVEDDAAGVAGAWVSLGQVECRECGRTFSRQEDLKRHKCLEDCKRHKCLASGTNQSRSSEVLCIVQLVRGGLKVQEDQVCTGRNSTTEAQGA